MYGMLPFLCAVVLCLDEQSQIFRCCSIHGLTNTTRFRPKTWSELTPLTLSCRYYDVSVFFQVFLFHRRHENKTTIIIFIHVHLVQA